MYFFVEGKPQGKARPRFSQKTHTTYTPKNTADYEKRIRNAFRECQGEWKKLPADCYAYVKIQAQYPIPRSWSKRKKKETIAGLIIPTTKPDGDNILKVVLDALNGLAYDDDRQVVKMCIIKVYGANPGLVVQVGEYKVQGGTFWESTE